MLVDAPYSCTTPASNSTVCSDKIDKLRNWLFFRGYGLVVALLLCFSCLTFIVSEDEGKNTATLEHLQSMSYFEDPDGSLTATSVASRNHLFSRATGNSLNFGLSDSVYWVWLKLKRTDAAQDSLYVELGYPHIDQLDVFRLDAGIPVELYKLGDMIPFGTRPIKDRAFVIPVLFDQEASMVQLLLRARSKGSIQMPIEVKHEKEYQLADRDEQMILGIYYGVLFGVLAYNLLLALGTREPVYGYYCAYAVFLILFLFSQNGLAFEYLWPNHTLWQQISIPLFASLALLFCTRFTQLFLNICSETRPRLCIVFNLMLVVFGALALASLVVDRALVITLVALAVSLAGMFMMGAALYIYLRGDDNAFYYLLAWTILLFGVVVYSTKTLGIIPETFITEYSVQIGSAIEMVLLSYALADRIKRLRDENVRIYNEANSTLESRVEQRTHELRQTMVQLESVNSQLELMNQQDPMTGLYNRRYFNEILEPLRSEMLAVSKPVSLLMVDIDHFKSINDTKGHLIGDEVIQKIADLIASAASDELCVPVRFGGEEFVVLMPGYDRDTTMVIAEELRCAIGALEFSVGARYSEHSGLTAPCVNNDSEKCFAVTSSIGITTEEPFMAATQSGLQLLDQADQALYAAKESGRNQCVFYQASIDSSFAA